MKEPKGFSEEIERKEVERVVEKCNKLLNTIKGKSEKGKIKEKNLLKLYNLLEQYEKKVDGEKRKEIEKVLVEIREVLRSIQEDVIKFYNERKIGNVDVKRLNDVNFYQGIVNFLGLEQKENIDKEKKFLEFLKYDKITVESFFRNFSIIKEIVDNVTKGKEDISNLSGKEKNSLEKKLKTAGYNPDGGWWDLFGHHELETVVKAVNFVSSKRELLDRAKVLEQLFIWGITPVQLERSKLVLQTINEDEIFDWLGDYDGNGELARDDKGIYHGQQLAEMFKRFEKMNSENFYKNITSILKVSNEQFKLGWRMTVLKNKNDLLGFFKKYPEAKYVLIKQYEKMPIENLAMSKENFIRYLDTKQKILEKNLWLRNIDNRITGLLISKLERSLPVLKHQLRELLRKEGDPRKREQIKNVLRKIETRDGKEEIILKLKPSVLGIIISLVRNSEGVALGAGWQKNIESITDGILSNVDLSLGMFYGKNHTFIPGITLSVSKEVKIGKGKDENIIFHTGTVMGIVFFSGLNFRKTYGLHKFKNPFDYNKKLKYLGVGVGVSTIGWGINFEEGDKRLEAIEKNMERFGKLLDEILKIDLREEDIDLQKISKKFGVDMEILKQMVNNVKSVVKLYPDIDWKMISQDIKNQYLVQFYDNQKAYLLNYHNNEVSGWNSGVFLLGWVIPLPFVYPKITHYSKKYIPSGVDKLRDYSYVYFANKNLETVSSLSEVVKKLEAVFNEQVEIEITKDNKLRLYPADKKKNIFGVLNVYVSPDKLSQVKYSDGSLIIGNVGSIYGTFIAEGKGIVNYLILGSDKIDGTIKLGRDNVERFEGSNSLDSVSKRLTLSTLTEKIGDIAKDYFIEKKGGVYLDVNKDGKYSEGIDVDVTHGGYEITISPDGQVYYIKTNNNNLVIKYYKKVKDTKKEIEIPKEVKNIKKEIDLLWKEKWVDFARLRTKKEYKKFELYKMKGNFDKAFAIGISLLEKYIPHPYNKKLTNKIKNLKGEDMYYMVDIMDRYFRTDIEFSSKLHRIDLLRSLKNSNEYNLLNDKEKEVVDLLLNGNIGKAAKLAQRIGYVGKQDNSIATMFSYLDGRLKKLGDKRAGDSFKSIFKQLYFAHSDYFGGAIFGLKHDRERVFKQIFKSNGLNSQIVDNVLNKLRKQIDANKVVPKKMDNVIGFTAISGIVDTGNDIYSTGKGLHGQIPGIIEAVQGTIVTIDDDVSRQKVVDMIIDNNFYKKGIKNFVDDLLKRFDFKSLTNEQLKNLLTNGLIKLNNGYEIKLDRDFIAFAYDVCGNVSIGMKINVVKVYKGGELIFTVGGLKFGIDGQGVMRVNSTSKMKVVVGIVLGSKEEEKEKEKSESKKPSKQGKDDKPRLDDKSKTPEDESNPPEDTEDTQPEDTEDTQPEDTEDTPPEDTEDTPQEDTSSPGSSGGQGGNKSYGDDEVSIW